MFVFQQPGSIDVLTAIDRAANGATRGGALFAFASKKGSKALLDLNEISRLTDTGTFDLIVGIDAITNAEALLYLQAEAATRAGLTARAFLHDYPGTFHPKFAWFREGDAIRIVVGSGNLTLSGMGQAGGEPPPFGNWEAFTSQSLAGQDGQRVAKAITDWIETQIIDGTLLSLDDNRVRLRAVANGRARFKKRSSQPAASGSAPAVTLDLSPLDEAPFGDREVLLRELPKTRPGQADIGHRGLSFFGYVNTATTALVQNVSLTNIEGPLEELRLFVNRSRNFRIELNAISALGYERRAGTDERMILVAVKLDSRSFRYTVIPVTSPHYHRVSRLLGDVVTSTAAGSRRMRELLTSTTALRRAWKNAPTNLLPAESADAEP